MRRGGMGPRSTERKWHMLKKATKPESKQDAAISSNEIVRQRKSSSRGTRLNRSRPSKRGLGNGKLCAKKLVASSRKGIPGVTTHLNKK